VSDHGEEFLEHGGWDHGRTLYAEVLNVPLVFCSSAAVVPARRVAERVSVLDVLPTLLDAAGLPASPAHEGRSLLPAITGDAAPPLDRDFFADLRSAPWFGCRVLKAVVRGDEKCVFTLPDGVELYDLAADPWEQRSLADGRDDVVADLRSRLDRFEAGCARYAQETTPVVLDAQTLEKLRSLGYAN